jgi:hypothetical protein
MKGFWKCNYKGSWLLFQGKYGKTSRCQKHTNCYEYLIVDFAMLYSYSYPPEMMVTTASSCDREGRECL